MSSTNFNVGLGEGRNSSRVLKPPGGGHTDIFGVHEEEKPNIIRKAPVNNINNFDEPKETKEQQHTEEAVTENDPPRENEPPKEVNNPAHQRVRVPPGGFSSGFW